MILWIANHEAPRGTVLHDRANDAISLDEIERMLVWRELPVLAVDLRDNTDCQGIDPCDHQVRRRGVSAA